MWVKFLDNYRHKISRAVVRHYKKGMTLSVPTAHATAAIAAGKAEEVERPTGPATTTKKPAAKKAPTDEVAS